MGGIITTDRLILRSFMESDAEDFLAYYLEGAASGFLGGFPPEDRDNALVLFRSFLLEKYHWAVELGGKVIGEVTFGKVVNGYLAHVGYLFNKDYQGKGYGAEAVNAVVGYGFGIMGLGRVRAETMLANTRSQKLLERCGFSCEALLYEYDFGGKVADVMVYSRTE